MNKMPRSRSSPHFIAVGDLDEWARSDVIPSLAHMGSFSVRAWIGSFGSMCHCSFSSCTARGDDIHNDTSQIGIVKIEAEKLKYRAYYIHLLYPLPCDTGYLL